MLIQLDNNTGEDFGILTNNFFKKKQPLNHCDCMEERREKAAIFSDVEILFKVLKGT